MMDADGANVVRLTSISDEDGDPAWSPDGSRIAYYCSSKVGSDICVIEVDE
jgi:Tol biopolymer transport system component